MVSKRSRVDPSDGRTRCGWAATDPMLAAYHDIEWGRPIRTAHGHLERMALEIFQCGLSWKIVLVKRPALRTAFNGFNVDHVATMTARDVKRLCADAAIIRNRRKIEAVIYNAAQFQAIARANGSYTKWLAALPTNTPQEIAGIYTAFRQKFKFMGPETTKCYLMGCGKIAPDHEPNCWRAT